MHEGSKKAIAAAFLANLGIAIVKFLAFLVSGAASMLAESIHSLADTGNQALLFLGGRRATRAPDRTHQFGYGTARYFWSFVVALVLFSMGGLFAIYEGIQKLIHPHELGSVVVPIVVLGLSIVLESLSFRTAIREAAPMRNGRTWWQFLRRTKNPELPVVLLEDSGALIGLLIALVGLILAAVTGEARFDAAGSLAIGILLVIIAVFLAIEMASLLLGEAVDPADEATIQQAIETGAHVRRVIHLRTNHLGPDDVLVATKVEFDPTLTVAQLADAIDDTEAKIRAVFAPARLIFIEPDLYEARNEPDPAP